MDKPLRNTLISGIIIIAISIAFYSVYYLPNKERVIESARKDCINSSIDSAKNNSQITETGLNLIYKVCMNKKGLAD